MNVKSYLESRYKRRTVQTYYDEWKDFENYLYQLNLSIEKVDYSLLINYIEQLQKRKLKEVTINRKLLVIEQICRHLLPKGRNPVKGFRVKTSGRNPLSQPLEIEHLQETLKSLPKESIYQKRNVLMLSLIHNQALRIGEIKALKVEDINLNKAQITIPRINRSNSRTLDLKALQVVEMQEYLKETRPELLQYPTSQLFITGGSSRSLANSFLKLKRQVQKRLPKLKNLEHWRSSIIVNWLEYSPLLEVQARLGHRYASSTERYKVYAIKSLQKELTLHHPLQ